MTQLWPLTLSWLLLTVLFIVIHTKLKPEPVPSIRGSIFAAEMVVLSLLFGAFALIELDRIGRGERPHAFVVSALELLLAFTASLGVYKHFSKGEQ